MSDRGLCSRREADRYIEKGLVKVDGQIVSTLGTKVLPTVKIELLESATQQQQRQVSIILNKPIRYTSQQTDKDYPTVLDLIQAKNQILESDGPRFSARMKQGLGPVGRLDIESQGLMLMTQDGRIAKAVIGPQSQMEKEYLVRFTGDVTPEKLKVLREGHLQLDRRQLKPAKIERINEDQLRFTLTEGVNRQIRRMMEAVDLTVTGLKRVRIGPVRLGPLPEGFWRTLTAEEISLLLKNSSSLHSRPKAPRR